MNVDECTEAPTKASTDAPKVCQFADGTPGTKCDGNNACAGLDLSKVGCGSCMGDSPCFLEYTMVLLIKFLWERIAVMGLWPVLALFKKLCQVETMLKLVKEVGE